MFPAQKSNVHRTTNFHEWEIGNCGLFIVAISHVAIAELEIIFGYYALKKGMQKREKDYYCESNFKVL